MPKNLIQESIRHHLLRVIQTTGDMTSDNERVKWQQVSETLEVIKKEDGSYEVRWRNSYGNEMTSPASGFKFYQRGDLIQTNKEKLSDDHNRIVSEKIVHNIALSLELTKNDGRLRREEAFHNRWACHIRPEEVMVDASFEACTAPENRFILSILGDIKNKHLLDLGSGLGEASVYFAKKGALVTSCDLSGDMLAITSQVARYHGVTLNTHQAAAEQTGLSSDSFDIVYAGNLLHHVDISIVLDEIYRLLKPGGIFVSWDPLIHNPIINIYRRMAQTVRTVDEHPLRIEELKLFEKRFRNIKWKCFWLVTLVIFLRFFFWERIHPSQERYWKKIITDANRLTPFYKRLEKMDKWILKRFPCLQKYCWNIVIYGQK